MGTEHDVENEGTAIFGAFSESNSNEAEEDSIEFGDGVIHSKVVSFNKNESVESVPPEEEEIVPVSHTGEGTLLCGSAQLDLVEEMEGEKEQVNQHHGLIITLIVLVILAGVGSLFYFLSKQEDNNDPEKTADETLAVGEIKKIEREYREYEFKTTPFADSVLVNGVPPKLSDGYNEFSDIDQLQLLTGVENMLTFSEANSVPLTVMIEKERDAVENPIEYILTEGEMYQHSTLVIKAPPNMDIVKGVFYLNGKETKAEKELQVEVISGMPYFIHAHQKDMGDHLQIIWPTKTREEVALPALELLANSERATVLNIDVPKDYQKDTSFVLNVLAENEYTHKPGKRTIAKGELIKVDMSKDKKEPLQLIIDSTPFGSISIDAYLKSLSQKYAIVKYDRESPRDVTVCFRRVGETLCTNTREDNMIPSGKWEVKAYRMVGEKKEWLEGAPYEEIKPDENYKLSVRVKGEKFELSMNQPVGKNRKKSK